MPSVCTSVDACSALGIDCDGAVYGAWSYEAVLADELTFKAGDRLKIITRPSDAESDWWLARIDRKEGYVPRNYLSVCSIFTHCTFLTSTKN